MSHLPHALAPQVAPLSKMPSPESPPPVTAGPPLSLVIREKYRAYISPFPYTVGAEGEPSLPEMREDAVFSPNGSAFVGIETTDQCVVTRDALSGDIVSAFGGVADEALPLKFNFATFSPRGTFILAWARPVTGSSHPNLVVADTATGGVLTSFFQKNFHIDHWPSLQWSTDEAVAARCVANTVHIFDGADLASGLQSKIHIPGVTSFALSPAAPHHIAAFVMGKSGSPGRIALYAAGGEEVVTRSTFRAESVEFKWASTGAACLALSSTNSDSSGKSYYGESEAYYLDVATATHKRIELPQEGPTYDVAWSPGGREFIVIYGFMPARATMFNEACEPVFDFGTGSRNTISFSPHGKFLALAGFGSLAGTVQFWDKNKLKLVGSVNLNATTDYSWSPCSRYFLAATTFPRLRVDNMIRVVRFDGQVIHEHRMTDTLLLQARFRPAFKSAYLEPKLTMMSMIGGPPVDPLAKPAPGATAKKAGGAYRPPGARGTAASFSLHREVEAGKVDKASFMSKGSAGANDTGAVRRVGLKKLIPGLEEEDEKNAGGGLSKAAAKRKKKKEKDQEKERLAASGAAPVPAVAGNEAPKGIEELDTVEAVAKKIKGLKKKLRSVDLLKARVEAGREASMNVDQIEKLKSEPALKEQIEVAEKKLSALSQS